MYVKFKCEFWLAEVKFFGHVVSSEGMLVDASKVEEMRDWKTPNSVSEIHSFLSLASYDRCLIKGLSKIASPLTQLTRKHVAFK